MEGGRREGGEEGLKYHYSVLTRVCQKCVRPLETEANTLQPGMLIPEWNTHKLLLIYLAVINVGQRCSVPAVRGKNTL